MDTFYFGVLAGNDGKFYPVELRPLTTNPLRCVIEQKYDAQVSLRYAWAFLMNLLMGVIPGKDLHFFNNTLTEKEVL